MPFFVYSFVCSIPHVKEICERTVIAENFDDAIYQFERSMGQIEFDDLLNTKFQIMEPAIISQGLNVKQQGQYAFVDGYICIVWGKEYTKIVKRCKKLDDKKLGLTAVVYSGDYYITPQ